MPLVLQSRFGLDKPHNGWRKSPAWFRD